VSVRSGKRIDLNWILVVLLTVFAVAPLTYPGFFQVQSGYLPVFNAEHISDAPHWGRPADPLRGEAKLPYLLVWPFFQLSGSGIVAIGWGYGLAFVLGALGVYVWARHWLGARGGLLAALVYTYLPWHLTTIYVRGAYAEAWLWALWPFALWALDRLAEDRPLGILMATTVGLPVLAATFWTQPGLAALATPLLVAYHMTLTSKGRRLALRLGGALAVLFLTLWFAGQRAPEAVLSFTDHVLYPFQLLSAAWGDEPSFQLGMAAVGLSIVAVAFVLHRTSQKRKEAKGSPATLPDPPDSPISGPPLGRVFWLWLAILLTVILLVLPPVAFLWQATGLDRFLSYPWQLLALTGPPLAFLSGSAVRLDNRLAELPALAGLVSLVVLASYPYLAPRFTQVNPGPEPVALIQPLDAQAPQILMLDYAVVPPAEITPTLTLTLTWQVIEPVTGDYTVFVHVLDQDGSRVAQRDARPCNGECPTNTWEPGELIVDRHQLELPPGSLSRAYLLATGLYLLDTGERASVVGRDDGMVILDVP
jgi:hypothetical protein